MPHIVFDQRINLADFSEKFHQIFQKQPCLIRVADIFLNKDGNTALLPSVAIHHIHQRYLIEISTSRSKTVIRLYPGTDPEKTDEVRLSLALVARQIMENYPGFQVTKTNLGNHLERVTG